MDPALDLCSRLREDAASHIETAHCCDCRPEDTVNWRHAQNAQEAAKTIEQLQCEAQKMADQLAIAKLALWKTIRTYRVSDVHPAPAAEATRLMEEMLRLPLTAPTEQPT